MNHPSKYYYKFLFKISNRNTVKHVDYICTDKDQAGNPTNEELLDVINNPKLSYVEHSGV